MKPIEPTIHSFIIKIRLTELEADETPVDWYGQIVHVPSGQRTYIRSLKEISCFITPYLREMGIDA
jgi:hypothetical protein